MVQGLGVNKLACVVGASMGGMIALAFSYLHPSLTENQINISSGKKSLPFTRVIRSFQRALITEDPAWNLGRNSKTAFPVRQQEEIANDFITSGTETRLVILDSVQGHDAFLTDIISFSKPINEFLTEIMKTTAKTQMQSYNVFSS